MVDGRIGFTGGSGVSSKWMGDGRIPDHWRDTDVQIEGPVELVKQSLRALPGVERVETRGAVDGVVTYALDTTRTRDVRRDVGQLAAQQRWPLLELRALDLSLEDVFIRIVAGEEHDPATTDADDAAPTPAGEVGA